MDEDRDVQFREANRLLDTMMLLVRTSVRRQEQVREVLKELRKGGCSLETIARRLGISAESVQALIDQEPLPVHERLEISPESAEDLLARIGEDWSAFESGTAGP